ncbi:MFS transporter [Janibacter sp. G368]|uniref:MFS transporter n=1 Tax=Janibacter sp. G368 TaxID=3420441 RepID=UPI003D08FC3D
MSQDRLAERAPAKPPAPVASTWITLAALLSAGWATNHFAAMLPVLAEVAHISKPGLDAAFGLYALGLLPSLLLGGGLSDRHGRRPVVVTGLVLAGLGNLVMIAWSTLPGVTVGRLVVGLGVGMVASAGTAWAADQDETKGAARAGVLLTSGFAVGPVATALIAWAVPGRAGAHLAFAVPVVLTAIFALLCLRVVDRGPSRVAARRAASGATPPAPVTDERRLGPALAASLPMALWVFACVTVAMIVLTERIDEQHAGPLLPAVAAVLSLGTGVLAQVGMRRVGGWRGLGVVGAALATTGYVIAGGGRAGRAGDLRRVLGHPRLCLRPVPRAGAARRRASRPARQPRRGDRPLLRRLLLGLRPPLRPQHLRGQPRCVGPDVRARGAGGDHRPGAAATGAPR